MTRRSSFIHLVCATVVLTLAFWNKNFSIEIIKKIPYLDYLAESLFRLVVTFLITDIIHQIIKVFYKPESPGKRDNFLSGIKHISRLVYALYLSLLLLAILNISLEKALTTLSLLAAAVVLITKDYISNFINGMYMTFARIINIGDEVQIGNHKGKIQYITLSSVHLINDDDDLIYVPNNVFFGSDFINYTRREIKKISLDFEADLLSIPSVTELQNEIWNSVQDFHSNIIETTVNLKVVSITSEEVKFKFQYIMIDNTDKNLEKTIKKATIRSIVSILNERKKMAESLRS
ncbi:MAG: mechanosensitive ion channel family protein [Bacteroidota bacterium]